MAWRVIVLLCTICSENHLPRSRQPSFCLVVVNRRGHKHSKRIHRGNRLNNGAVLALLSAVFTRPKFHRTGSPITFNSGIATTSVAGQRNSYWSMRKKESGSGRLTMTNSPPPLPKPLVSRSRVTHYHLLRSN